MGSKKKASPPKAKSYPVTVHTADYSKSWVVHATRDELHPQTGKRHILDSEGNMHEFPSLGFVFVFDKKRLNFITGE